MIGETVSHFKILEQLGEGAMGVVYKAQDLKLDRHVALKFLPEELTTDTDAKRRFTREAKAASALDHPNICTIHEVDELPDGRMFIAMGYYEGESLRERIDRQLVSPQDAVALVSQIASGLAAAHQKGIVHRDMKPANILITKDGQIKILDFGVAKLAGATRLTQAGSMVGTLAYMSPEQVSGREADARSDIFSLGVIFYEMLTEAMPFEADAQEAILYRILSEDPDPLSTHNPDLPEHFQDLLDRMLAKNPEDRLSTLDDFAVQLGHDNDLGVSGAQPKKLSIKTRSSGGILPGDRIGNYRLRERIGVGGMGEVWAADQEKSIQRRVALKIIKPGMDSKEVIARFEAERQALALMNHPNVAKVFDGGVTDFGRPFFVMEYVAGVPITEYCDRHNMEIPERLKLFQQVCEGVQHAHQKAIIHRDLKPTNVLVSEQDGKPSPKIIDFGVAKATTQRLTAETLYTQLGVLIGTPEYMSPEQAELTGDELDIRTDVYSLGAILYELLVGALPFEPSELRSAGFDGIRRMIRETIPPHPSVRLSTIGERITDSARTRRLTPERLRSQLKGDLDWIAMKALEKERRRRYSSAQALSDDIDNHLSARPVKARPPSKLYEMRRFATRHRVPVAAGFLILIALLVGGAMAAVGFVRASAAKEQAELEEQKALRVSQFLYSILEDSNPFGSGGVDLTVKDVLLRSLPRIDEELQGEYDIQGTLRHRLANAFFGFGDFEQSISLLRQALTDFERHHGGLNEDSEWVRHQLCWVTQKNDDFDESIALATKGATNARTLLGENSELEVRFLDVMGDTYRYKGDLDSAERYLRQAQSMLEVMNRSTSELVNNDIDINIKNNLALVLRSAGQLEEAESIFRETYEKNLILKGETHHITLLLMSNLARTLAMQEKYDEAETWYRRSIDLRTKMIGPDHPFTVMDQSGLEEVLAKTGRGPGQTAQ